MILSLNVHTDEVLVIGGESGCDKITLVMSMIGLCAPNVGYMKGNIQLLNNMTSDKTFDNAYCIEKLNGKYI